MAVQRCMECGDQRPLTGGVCTFRAACEHRVMQHEAEMTRLYEQMEMLDPLPCGHTRLEHAGMRQQMGALLRSWSEGYGPDEDPFPLTTDDW